MTENDLQDTRLLHRLSLLKNGQTNLQGFLSHKNLPVNELIQLQKILWMQSFQCVAQRSTLPSKARTQPRWQTEAKLLTNL